MGRSHHGTQDRTDWTYVNVRRLMLYIEESIQEGIRWAVFKPNDRPLWQSLKRTIGDFLDGCGRPEASRAKTRDQAYQVRIDEGLNPHERDRPRSSAHRDQSGAGSTGGIHHRPHRAVGRRR